MNYKVRTLMIFECGLLYFVVVVMDKEDMLITYEKLIRKLEKVWLLISGCDLIKSAIGGSR